MNDATKFKDILPLFQHFPVELYMTKTSNIIIIKMKEEFLGNLVAFMVFTCKTVAMPQ